MATEALQRFILNTATPHREDRLFPMNPNAPNSLCVAYGAAGTLHALDQALGYGQAIPSEFIDWFLRQIDSSRPNNLPPGLYVGWAGIARVLNDLGFHDRAMACYKQAMAQSHWVDSDLYSGCSGIGLVSLYFWNQSRDQRFLDDAERLGADLLYRMVETDSGYHWPNQDDIYIGLGRGASGISIFFSQLYKYTRREDYRQAALGALTHDLSCTKENHAGVRTSPETPDGNIFYPYWFRGSAGIVFALAKAYAVTEHSDVLDNIRILLPDVCRDITMFPGLFNGLAGIMVSLSSCAQYTGISTCYHFANRAREAISLFLVSEPEGYGVPSDYLIRMSNDLATGTAGVLLSLLHLSNASRCQDTYDDEFMIGTV